MALIILVFGFVFAVIAAFGWPQLPRPHFGWLALACLIAYYIFVGGARLLN